MMIVIFPLYGLLSVCFGLHECDAGFYGTNCSLQCRHPNYGLDCQRFCDCEERLCNATYGCHYHSNTTFDEEYVEPTVLSVEMKPRETNSPLHLVLIAAITSSGFLLVIISLIIVYLANRKHLSRRILKTEKFIDTVMADHSANRSRGTPRDLTDNEGPPTSRYELLSLNLSTDL